MNISTIAVTSQPSWRPVKITAELKSPIILNGDLALDALLAFAIFDRTGAHGKDAHAQVRIASANLGGFDIPVASGLQFDGRVRHRSETVGRRFRRDERSMDSFAGNTGARKCPWNVNESSDTYLSLLNTYGSRHAERITWLALGDPDWILEHMTGLHTIGARRNQGHGQLGDIVIDALELDGADAVYTILVNTESNRPTRTMPLEAWRALGGSEAEQRIDRVAYQHPVWLEHNLALCTLADNQLSAA